MFLMLSQTQLIKNYWLLSSKKGPITCLVFKKITKNIKIGHIKWAGKSYLPFFTDLCLF